MLGGVFECSKSDGMRPVAPECPRDRSIISGLLNALALAGVMGTGRRRNITPRRKILPGSLVRESLTRTVVAGVGDIR